ncbi:MAG: phosphatidate cytidylyltransferase [Selenomonadaceae bacterium]|nr:phosphatidate cytidylyltransferase [Selenomonadaceae bacterium]
MLTRIITGVVGIALAALVIQTGGLIFGGFAFLLSLIAWLEFSHAFGLKGVSVTIITGIIGLLLIWGCAYFGNSQELLAVLMGITLVILAETVLLHGRVTFPDGLISLGGLCYVGLPFAHLVLLRFWEQESAPLATPLGEFAVGAALIWIMFIGTWASDSFAYFVGSAIGRHKLCPGISPNKTIEGFLGSLVGTALTLAGLGIFFSLPPLWMALLGVGIAAVATLGDLVESVLKRHVGIKDSGRLIPGHGGVLDRFDSVLFTAPFVYYVALLTQFATA